MFCFAQSIYSIDLQCVVHSVLQLSTGCVEIWSLLDISDPPPGMVLRSSQRVVVRKRQSPSTPKPLASGGLVARRKNMYGSCSDTSESIVIDTVNPCLSREENSPAPSPPPSPLSTVSSVSRDEGINCLCGDTSVSHMTN